VKPPALARGTGIKVSTIIGSQNLLKTFQNTGCVIKINV
jgi:hypothetical protein